MLTFKQIEEILEPVIDEDATYIKFHEEYWDDMIGEGKSESQIIADIDNGKFWDWVDQCVPEDEIIYK